ncbi:MAG TPA: hypothetical protein DD670_11180 [Planctomycetaceae bacterium]|nr:hypothetical protein [Planctomycetaceae bacterium]
MLMLSLRISPVTALTFAIALQTSLFAAESESYQKAHHETIKTGRPMIVLVGADWCPACVTMKDEVVPRLKQRGVLRKVAFAAVDLDRQRQLGRKLTEGGPIPQLIMFRKTSEGWRRRTLIGGQSEKAVSTFIAEGIRLDQEAKQKEESKDKTG